MFHNITVVIGNVDISLACMNWCREQIDIHQNNITIENLFVIAMAMGSLLLHNLLWHYGDWIEEHTELKKSHIKKIYTASGYFSFMLMAVFLIYYTVFR